MNCTVASIQNGIPFEGTPSAINSNMQPAPAPKPLITVLGLGEMGIVHAENLSKQRGIRLGLASTRSDILSKTALRLHADKLYNSYQEALADPQVIAVVIATPPTSHPHMITICAQAHKHIFCEKPLGSSSTAIKNALAAVKEADILFMTGFQRRWDDAFATAKTRVATGELGRPVVIRCTSGDPEYPEKYQRDAERNSIMLDLAVHDIDMARWLSSSEVSKVYAVVDSLTYPNLKQTGDADVCVAILEMEDGTKVISHQSRALAYGYNVTTDFVGSAGTLQIGDLRKDDVVEISDCVRGEVIQWDFRERFKQAFESEMTAFAKLVCAEDVDAVLKDSRYAGTDDGLRATLVAEALVRSAESGMPEMVIYE